MAERKPPAPKKQYTYPVPAGPEVLAAASLTTTLMKALDAVTFDQLAHAFNPPSAKASKMLAEIRLDPRVFDLMQAHQEDLRMLRTSPVVNIALCPSCKTVSAVVGAAPTRCHLTLGCEGQPVKSGTVTKQELTEPDDQSLQDPQTP